MKKIWSIFDRSKKIELFIFSFFMSVNTALEAISISLLLPIIVSLTDNNFFDLYPRFSLFLNFFQEKFSTMGTNQKGNGFYNPKKKHQKTNAKTQNAKGSASIRRLRVRVIIVIRRQ